jgi:aminopeptidase N
MEGKYSADEAAHYIHSDLKQYLNESTRKQVDHIRFDNENPNHMFDSHSYAKGGRILHMLRYAIGDDAFFNGLKYYLTEYANQAVEVHQLRLAMEYISGQDLNWFFNQWFLASGHPQISVEQTIEDNRVSLTISQNQSLETTPLYRIPLEIGIYENGVIKRFTIELNKQEEEFVFKTSSKAELVIFDADHYLLADISFDKTDEQWMYQLKNAPHYFDRMEAVDSLANSTNFAMQSNAVKMALNDSFWAIKTQGLEYFEKADPRTKGTLEGVLIKIASTDVKSDVRTAAIYCLSTYFDQDENVPNREHDKLYSKLVKDPSYIVAGEALRALQIVEPTLAYKQAKEELSTAKKELKETVIYTVAKNGDASDSDLIHNEFNKATGFETVGMTYNLISFLEKQKPTDNSIIIQEIQSKITSLELWYQRYYTLKMLKEYTSENTVFNTSVSKLYQSILDVEKDEKVLMYLGVK